MVFTKGDMIKRESVDNIDKTNPAVVLWYVFTAIQNGSDKTPLGTFTISDGSITLGNITITSDEL